MYDFAYHRPSSAADAAAALAKNGDAKVVAGGMTLIPTLKQRLAQPSDLIDLGGAADLKGIKLEGGGITIGAMTTHAEVARSGDVQKTIPALAQLAGGIGDPQVRNRGTIGGSVANSDPAADYPAAVLGLGATIRTNKREIKADDFFKGMFDTVLAADEIVVNVELPIPTAAAYAKFHHPASRFAIVGVFVSRGPHGVRVAVTGAGPKVFRVVPMEEALQLHFHPDAVGTVAVAPDDLVSDSAASAEYRAHLIGVMARRAVAAAAA